jgi:hypothetical protein
MVLMTNIRHDAGKPTSIIPTHKEVSQYSKYGHQDNRRHNADKPTQGTATPIVPTGSVNSEWREKDPRNALRHDAFSSTMSTAKNINSYLSL